MEIIENVYDPILNIVELPNNDESYLNLAFSSRKMAAARLIKEKSSVVSDEV